MGLFTSNRRHRYDDERGFNRKRNFYDPNGGKTYKIFFISMIACLLLFFTILVIAFFYGFKSFTIMLSIAFLLLAVGCSISLPWIRKVESHQDTKFAYLVLGMIGLCIALWLIADIIGVDVVRLLFKSAEALESVALRSRALKTLIYLKFVTLISVQCWIIGFITRNILKYRNKMLTFQIIAYASCLVLDIYFLLLMLAWGINPTVEAESVFTFNQHIWKFFCNHVAQIIGILAIIYLAVVCIVVAGIERKRLYENSFQATQQIIDSAAAIKNSAEAMNQKSSEVDAKEQLTKLKSMFDDGLITEEEYNQKRTEIINKL